MRSSTRIACIVAALIPSVTSSLIKELTDSITTAVADGIDLSDETYSPLDAYSISRRAQASPPPWSIGLIIHAYMPLRTAVFWGLYGRATKTTGCAAGSRTHYFFFFRKKITT